MNHTPVKTPQPANTALVLGKKGAVSPWLASVQKATGLDPRCVAGHGCTYLLLDTSSSMAGAPMAEALQGAQRFNAECVAGGQALGLVCFASEATLVAEPSRSGIAQALAVQRCGGTTHMAAALELALHGLAGKPGRHTVVLATDGYPDDRAATLRAATRLKHAHVRVLTVGTTDSDTAFLAQLASAPQWAVVTSPGELGKALAASARLLLT